MRVQHWYNHFKNYISYVKLENKGSELEISQKEKKFEPSEFIWHSKLSTPSRKWSYQSINSLKSFHRD